MEDNRSEDSLVSKGLELCTSWEDKDTSSEDMSMMGGGGVRRGLEFHGGNGPIWGSWNDNGSGSIGGRVDGSPEEDNDDEEDDDDEEEYEDDHEEDEDDDEEEDDWEDEAESAVLFARERVFLAVGDSDMELESERGEGDEGDDNGSGCLLVAGRRLTGVDGSES